MVGPSEAARGPRRGGSSRSGHNGRSNSHRGRPAKVVVGNNPGRDSPAKAAGHSNTFRTRPNPSNTMRRNNWVGMVRPWVNNGKARGSAAPEPLGKASGKVKASEAPNNAPAAQAANSAPPNDAPNRDNNAASRPETSRPGVPGVISGCPDSDPAAASPAWPGPWS